MSEQMSNRRLYRFGLFVFDPRSGELSRDRSRIRLPGHAAALLGALLDSQGQVLTREELYARLWPGRTCVDFDHGLANAVQRLRNALGDSAAQPRYVETIPRRGFRFLAAVELVSPANARSGSWLRPRSGSWLRPWIAGARRPLRAAAALASAGLVAAALLLLQASRPAATDSGPPQAPPRLVVLPFADLTGDAAGVYLVDGLTEELITQLGRLPPDRLVVVARTSAMRQHGVPDLPRLARDLQVDYALAGSVRREGDRVRVSTRLVQVADGAQQWAGVFDRDGRYVLDLQSEIATRVAETLAHRLPAEWQSRLALGGTRNPAAREAYLRGRWFANRRTPADLARAIDELRRAVEIDAQFARAHAALAAALHFGGAVGLIDRDEARQLTREAAERALALDPGAGDALAVLAESRFRFGGKTEGVEAMFRRAVALRPQDADVLHWLGMFLALAGDTGEALATLQKARELDPLAAHLGADYASVLHDAGRHREAAVVLDSVRELDPLFPKTYLIEASIALDEGRYADAIAAMRRTIELSPDTPKYLASLAQVYKAAGRTDDARHTLTELRSLAARVHVAPDLIDSLEVELADHP
jgi:TolB-like protein/DNA-binding winged helix-turn-helix (wHTH) protein/Tfp pilus assembly protein PilF